MLDDKISKDDYGDKYNELEMKLNRAWKMPASLMQKKDKESCRRKLT